LQRAGEAQQRALVDAGAPREFRQCQHGGIAVERIKDRERSFHSFHAMGFRNVRRAGPCDLSACSGQTDLD